MFVSKQEAINKTTGKLKKGYYYKKDAAGKTRVAKAAPAKKKTKGGGASHQCSDIGKESDCHKNMCKWTGNKCTDKTHTYSNPEAAARYFADKMEKAKAAEERERELELKNQQQPPKWWRFRGR